MSTPAWFGQTSVEYTQHDEGGVTVIRYPGGSHPVRWRSDCDRCQSYVDTSWFPDHDAMPGCRSGRRDHCTCDGCF